MEYGFLSILPAIVAITLAIATREVIGSLFIAIWLGATFLNNYNPGTGLLQAVENFVLNSVTDPWNCAILIFTLLMGGMIGLITRSGGANAIANALAKRAKTARAGQLYTWLIGMLIFFDDYGSCLI
ncbi:MAG TPA: Na+/H+ antiporter NhaC family protein, partial [Bacillota bacterium]|nr:Na+/H+ antiporter NhaC family protein [Bacillota bacterium]